ncbi:hypothetical protein PMAC_000660 [Pneumocystis sp. 'macacae']|nr:hypothetical protein PMAC_000660 [Pneumocystis sp. 'macacae']
MFAWDLRQFRLNLAVSRLRWTGGVGRKKGTGIEWQSLHRSWNTQSWKVIKDEQEQGGEEYEVTSSEMRVCTGDGGEGLQEVARGWSEEGGSGVKKMCTVQIRWCAPGVGGVRVDKQSREVGVRLEMNLG